MRVLVTNFSTASQTVLKAIMIKLGHQTEATADGKVALEMLQRPDRPGLAILDSNLPGIDGFEVCRRIKADPANTDLCVIIMTRENDRSEVLKALDAGADDYLQKPFDLTEVAARLRIIDRRITERGLILKRIEELKTASSTTPAAAAPEAPAVPFEYVPPTPPFSNLYPALNELNSFTTMAPILIKALADMGFGEAKDSDATPVTPELTIFSAIVLPQKSAWLDLVIEMDLTSAGALFMAMTGMDESSLDDAKDTAGEILNLVQGALKTSLQNEYIDVLTPVLPTRIAFEKRDSMAFGSSESKAHIFSLPGAAIRVSLFPHITPMVKKTLNELKVRDVVADPVNLPGDTKLTLVNKGVMITDSHIQKLREMTGYGSIKVNFDMIVPSELSTRLMTA